MMTPTDTKFALGISHEAVVNIFKLSHLDAALSLGDDIMSRAAFLDWSENWRDHWTDLPTPYHVTEGAD
jgi:hypothetical protein